jgi:hypothetical protein
MKKIWAQVIVVSTVDFFAIVLEFFFRESRRGLDETKIRHY